MKLVKFFHEQLFYTPVAASVTKTGQEKQKDILRKYTLWIFLLKYNDARSFIKRQTSGTLSDNEWQWLVQRMTANDNDWYNEWHQMTMSGTMNDNE